MEAITDEQFQDMRAQACAHGMARVFEEYASKEAQTKGGTGEALLSLGGAGVELLKFLTKGMGGMAVNAGLIGGGALGVGASFLGQQQKSLDEKERRARKRIAYYQSLANRVAARAAEGTV